MCAVAFRLPGSAYAKSRINASVYFFFLCLTKEEMNPYLTRNPNEFRDLFLSLETRRDVASLLEVSYRRLVYHLYISPDEKKYKEFDIPKKGGGVRKIIAPSSALKILQQKLNVILLEVYTPKPSVFSFVNSRSIVDNADKHKNQRYVFNVDLEDFFPSINFGRVRGLFMGKPYNLSPEVATTLAQISCFKNQLPQGAPSSPIISNMICALMDSQLQSLAQKNKCYYSRYADDITFSTSIKTFPQSIAKAKSLTNIEVGKELRRIIEANGFAINKNKTRLYPSYRRQEVTGLTVNEFPNVRRKYVRQVRAMLYAWERFGIENAEAEYYKKYDEKFRNPDFELPRFSNIVKGKIEFLGMVRGKENEIYKRYLSQYIRLKGRDSGVPILLIREKDSFTKPRVFVEGVTDKSILEIAWKKCYGDVPIQFIILDSDPLKDPDSPSGSGGASQIVKNLTAKRFDIPQFISIGLLDFDEEGIKSWRDIQKVKDFELDNSNNWLISPRRKAGVLLYPVPDFRKEYGDKENFCVEYYFSDETLDKKNEKGIGLEFSRIPPKVKKFDVSDEVDVRIPGTRIIKNGKVVFATEIVPLLDNSEFDNFKELFKRIIDLINEIQKFNGE